MVGLAFDRLEIIVGKAENASDQCYLLFPRNFQTFFSRGSLKLNLKPYDSEADTLRHEHRHHTNRYSHKNWE